MSVLPHLVAVAAKDVASHLGCFSARREILERPRKVTVHRIVDWSGMEVQVSTRGSALSRVSWREFLDRWSRELIATCHDEVVRVISPEPLGSDWIGRQPATAVQVAAAEQRLGLRLPPSYVQFLRESNGWSLTGAFGVAGLRPVQEVGWFRDLEAEWRAIWYDTAGDPQGREDLALMDRALVVSQPGEMALLLDPAQVFPDGEWAACEFNNDNPGPGSKERSFRQLMEGVYASFVRFRIGSSPSITEAEALIESAYRQVLDGDIDAFASIDQALAYGSSTRARLLALQRSVMRPSAGVGLSIWSHLAQLPFDELTDRELAPMGVHAVLSDHHSEARLLERRWRSESPELAARIDDLISQFRSAGGLEADFSYSPAFASAVEHARPIAAADPSTARAILLGALPNWTPLTNSHLLPLGVLYDRRLQPVARMHDTARLLLTTPRTTQQT